MRTVSCILGVIILNGSLFSAPKNAFEFDDLTPITPIEPKVKAAQPAPAKKEDPKKNREPVQKIPPMEKKEEAKKKLDLSPEEDFDLIPEKEPKKAIEPISSLPALKKEEKKSPPQNKEINLSPEKPFPIPSSQQSEIKEEAKLKETAEPKALKELPPPRPLGDLSSNDGDSELVIPGNQSWMALLFLLFGGGLIFLYLWYQKFLRGKMQSHGIDIQVLGQTFLDGQTKIVLLKVGQKVIIMAKSPNFCNTLDIITDPEEINLLTLGSSAAANGEDFSNVLNDMQRTARPSAKSIPHEQEMRSELDQLKKQLGQYQKEAR